MKGSVTSIADKTLSFHRFMIFLFHWNVLHCYLKVCFLLFQHSKLTVLQAKMGFFMFQYKTSNNGLSSDHGILGFSLCYVKLHTSLPLHQLTLRDGGRVEQKIFEDRFIHKYQWQILSFQYICSKTSCCWNFCMPDSGLYYQGGWILQWRVTLEVLKFCQVNWNLAKDGKW